MDKMTQRPLQHLTLLRRSLSHPRLGLSQRPCHLGRWKDGRTEPSALSLGRGKEEPRLLSCPSSDREGSDKETVTVLPAGGRLAT